MRVIDLTEELCPLYLLCLEDWSAEAREAGSHRAEWYRALRDRGLRVKLAQDPDGVVGGMIQYVPIEHAPAIGHDLYFVLCIWVHGHEQGRGNFQGRGMGAALLRAAEEDVRSLGAKGLAAWGIVLRFFMRARWFRKHGYTPVDRDGMSVLLWKPFSSDAEPPRWLRPRRAVEPGADRVRVQVFSTGWCLGLNLAAERVRRAAAELGEGVDLEWIDAKPRAVREEWGISDAVFIDGKALRTGPPPSYDRVRKTLGRAVRRRARRG